MKHLRLIPLLAASLLTSSLVYAYQIKTDEGITNSTFLVNPTNGNPYTSIPVTISGGGSGGATVAIDQTTVGTTDSVTVKASAGIGSLTEAAPGTDTASSGLNGRLQRIAQRLTSLIGLLPTGLTGSGNLKVAIVEEGRTKTVSTFLDAVTTNQTSAAIQFGIGRRVFQASISGTGVVSGTVTCYGNTTNSNSGGVLLATMTLSGTTSDTAGADVPAEWPYHYCTLASLTGTGATVTVNGAR